jgi:hypothetical protein
MQPRFRKIAVFVGSGALAAGVAAGVAGKGDDTTQAAATQQQPQQDGRPGGRMDLSALAEQLGVTTGKLQAAMESARSTAGVPDEMAAALARALGLSEAEVSAALEANRPDGAQGMPPGTPPDGTTPPSGATATPDGTTPPSGTTATPDGTTTS